MAKKYLLVDNEVIAKQKSAAALQVRYPNRDAAQLAAHNADPQFLHPSKCSKYLNGWKKHPLNDMCEIEIDEGELHCYDQGDQGKVTDTASIEDEQD